MINKLYEEEFARKFSVCLYKNKKLMLGGMDFSTDFIHTDRGDKYPLLSRAGDFTEEICRGEYRFISRNGFAERLIGHLSPYAVYEAVVTKPEGECGFCFRHGHDAAVITLKSGADGRMCVVCGEEEIPLRQRFAREVRFSVQPRKNRFDVFVAASDFPEYITTFDLPAFEQGANESFFMNTTAALYCAGNTAVREVSFFMDSGVSQADIRTVRYENGDVITENGKIFLTVSVRLIEGCYQGVFSWIPGTAEFDLTGAMFFDVGDGEWGNDVASSLLYDRVAEKWKLWVCSFSHGHILAHAEFTGEPRYGKNVIDVSLVPALDESYPDTAFGGRRGDEDPDFYYDAQSGKWHLAVCRATAAGYRYFFYESSLPFDGYVCTGCGLQGAETGGSFIRYGDGLYFVCGNSFEIHSDYRVYEMTDLSVCRPLKSDHPDGGFRGWGTVFTVKQGTREKLYHLTFDRCLGSKWNWSYGNIYCFEAK